MGSAALAQRALAEIRESLAVRFERAPRGKPRLLTAMGRLPGSTGDPVPP